MARTERGIAEPARFALLGLLLAGPSHGYDLGKAFAGGTVLADILHLGQSNLYALLTRMERDRLIASAMEEAGSYPPRRVYSLTAAGRQAVERWLGESVGHPRDMRIDFPLKLYLLARTDRERALALIARQRAAFERYRARLEQQPIEESALEVPFLLLMRAGRIGRVDAALAWLERAEAVVQAGTGA